MTTQEENVRKTNSTISSRSLVPFSWYNQYIKMNKTIHLCKAWLKHELYLVLPDLVWLEEFDGSSPSAQLSHRFPWLPDWNHDLRFFANSFRWFSVMQIFVVKGNISWSGVELMWPNPFKNASNGIKNALKRGILALLSGFTISKKIRFKEKEEDNLFFWIICNFNSLKNKNKSFFQAQCFSD